MAKNITICFTSWHFKTNEIFLDYLRKMTPGQLGKWKNMTAITDPSKADYIAIMDGTNVRYDPNRAIFFGAHPKIEGGFSPSFRTFEDKQCVAKIRLDKHLNAGEYWIDYTYDELVKLEPPKKTKNLACIMTYQTHNAMYAQRVKFMQALVNYTGGKELDLYGRQKDLFEADPVLKSVYKGPLGHQNPDGKLNQHTTGKNILLDYKCSIEMDVGPTRNYLSERFYDAMLLWSMPIYFGSTNVEDFLPKLSFETVNIHDLSNANMDNISTCLGYDWTQRVIVNRQNSIDKNKPLLKEFAEARDLLLNKYQIWPYLFHVINNLEKYQ